MLLAVKVEGFSDKTYALGQKKPGFLPNLRAATKYFCKKTRFLDPMRKFYQK
jgi:hypothetical protein